MSYTLARKLLFSFSPEAAHAVALHTLNMANACGLLSLIKKSPENPRKIMNINFTNPIGLAAGLDKNGDYIDALSKLGFGFIEIGTITPRAQKGNPKPRLFRLPQQRAIINRMGFNNKGVDYLCERVKKIKYQGVLGINIGKNKDTPLELAVDDYLICLRKVYALANYITINISSPNTAGLRDLQYGEKLAELLQSLKVEQLKLANEYDRYIPLVVKIAPDLAPEEIQLIAQQLLDHKLDGVIATNTTLSRTGVEDSVFAKQEGGLSGQPLTSLSTHVIKLLHTALQGKIPIIGVGGIMSVEDAQAKLAAGASLLQVYSGFIYEGPGLIRKLSETTY